MTKRDSSPLTGALFVVLTLLAFLVLGGSTPDGDASARKVVSFYDDNGTREIFASAVLALGAVPLVAFAATVRERFRSLMPEGSILPTFAFGGGVLSATGFCVAATIHFALADYADNIGPVAAQAINAIDSDFFLPFTTGLAILMLATSLMTIKVGVLPKWMGWVGVVLFVVFFTPAGFIAFGLSAFWLIAVSVLLYLRPAGHAGPAAART
jgi:hypothetical protein